MTSYLITGGTGTFGNAMVEHLLAYEKDCRVRVFSRDEFKQHEMRNRIPDQRLDFFLGDVRDRDRLALAMKGVDYVFHAAALKQVPACEYNPTEAIRTNINGTENACWAALQAGVKGFLLISTDKASAPVTIYGATKLAAERLVCAFNAYAGGKPTPAYNVIRYGNVAGSRGSIIPVWRDMIAQKRTIQVTDPSMTRFWITKRQAVEFACFAIHSTMFPRGSVVVRKLPSFQVGDLACLFTDRPEIIGPRNGEKAHECMVSEDEASNARIFSDGKEIYTAIHPSFGHEACAMTSDQATRMTKQDLRVALEGV